MARVPEYFAKLFERTERVFGDKYRTSYDSIGVSVIIYFPKQTDGRGLTPCVSLLVKTDDVAAVRVLGMPIK